jgi:hypothetical protein
MRSMCGIRYSTLSGFRRATPYGNLSHPFGAVLCVSISHGASPHVSIVSPFRATLQSHDVATYTSEAVTPLATNDGCIPSHKTKNKNYE